MWGMTFDKDPSTVLFAKQDALSSIITVFMVNFSLSYHLQETILLKTVLLANVTIMKQTEYDYFLCSNASFCQ